MKGQFIFYLEKDYPSEHRVQRHTHPCYELTYYLEGECSAEIDDKTYAFPPNTFALIKPYSVHSEAAKKHAKVLCLGLQFSNSEIKQEYFSDSDGEILNLIKEAAREENQKKAYYAEVLNTLAEKIYYYVLRLCPHDETQQDDFNYILDYIFMHANENTNIQKIAKELCYNYDYFRAVFRKNMGVSAKDYLMKLKIENAKEFLLTTAYPVNQIAQIVGFSNASHFCSAFLKSENCTPNEFRKTHSQKK